MTPEDREALFRVAHWMPGQKRLVVRNVRQLAGTEENYLFLIREIDRVRSQVERARVLDTMATLTLVDWLTTLEMFNWHCAYCQSRPFQVMSHLVPLPHGGTTPENCVPACYHCSGKRKASDRERLQTYLAEARHHWNGPLRKNETSTNGQGNVLP